MICATKGGKHLFGSNGHVAKKEFVHSVCVASLKIHLVLTPRLLKLASKYVEEGLPVTGSQHAIGQQIPVELDLGLLSCVAKGNYRQVDDQRSMIDRSGSAG